MNRALILASVLACGAVSLHATISFITQPTPSYIAGTTLLPIAESDGSFTSSESDSNLTISFLSSGSSITMDVTTVGDGWATWGSPPNTEGNTPKVVYSDDSFTDVVFQFSVPLTTFGVELEPNDTLAPTHTITANFLLGSTSIGTLSRDVSGNAGALLFAGTGDTFDSVEVSSDNFFAAAQFRYVVDASSTPVPEPSAGVLVLIGLGIVTAVKFAMRALTR
jgi:hypothetical protein